MNIKSILATTISFCLLDGLWIKFVAADLYQRHVTPLLRMQNNQLAAQALPALLFYAVALLAIIVLIVKPAVSITQACFNGALIGLFAYGTYALTCQSIYQGWIWKMTLLDIAWGVFLCATAAAAGAYFK